jgi:two-component system chemotaxis response regulator CheY
MMALIVDDSKTNRLILDAVLKRLGIETFHASDGAEALSFLAAHRKPNIVFVDWYMPVMDGLELLKQIRSIPDYQGIRVVMVTKETDTQRISDALRLGADEYVMKPYTASVIKDKLQILGLLINQAETL